MGQAALTLEQSSTYSDYGAKKALQFLSKRTRGLIHSADSAKVHGRTFVFCSFLD